MEPEFVAIGPNDEFHFTCSPDVPCFNACCHNLYQVLTPYDVLRLKNFLQLTSGDFLERYTQQAIGPETGLPVVSLRPDAANDMACPFVTPKGCRVYTDRPASCRIYPLARAVSRCRKSGRLSEHHALLQEAHCKGFNRGGMQSVAEWISSQELAIYNSMNDRLLEIIALKNHCRPGALDLAQQRIFCLALYDLDGFREYLKGDGKTHAPSAELKTLLTEGNLGGDIELLKFGFRWIGEILSV